MLKFEWQAWFSDLTGFSTGEISYIIAAAFGGLIIYFFSSRRLELLSEYPSGAEFQVVKLLTASSLVGARIYKKSFRFYVCVLELIFIFICAAQPFFEAFFETPLANFKFDGAVWPLMAALVVVGLLPATPLIEKIEIEIRRLAHQAANIPQGFIERISRIEHANIEDQFEVKDEEVLDGRPLDSLFRLLIALGYTKADSQFYVKQYKLALLFNRWLLSVETPEYWNSAVIERLGEACEFIKPKSVRALSDFDQLTRRSVTSKYFTSIVKELGEESVHDQNSAEAIRKSNSFQKMTVEKSDLKDIWDIRLSDLSLLTKELQALFVIFSTNETRPVEIKDSVFNKAVEVCNADRSVGSSNTLIICASSASAAYFIFSLSTMLCLQGVTWADLTSINAAGWDDLVGKRIKWSVNASLETLILFLIAGTTALKARNSDSIDERINELKKRGKIPVNSYLLVAFYALVIAFIISFVYYVIFQYNSGNMNSSKALSQSDITQDVINMCTDLVSAAVLCTYLAIFVRGQGSNVKSALIVPLSLILFTFVKLVLNPYIKPDNPLFLVDLVRETAMIIMFVGTLYICENSDDQQGKLEKADNT